MLTNFVALMRILSLFTMFDTSWTVLSQDDFVFLSSPTAQSNKPHATSHVPPATSPEINSRGQVSPMSQSKQIQKGAALDNWSLLLQLQYQYFSQSWLSAHFFLQPPPPPSSPHMLYIFLSDSSLPFNTSYFLLFFHSGNPSYKIPLQNND